MSGTGLFEFSALPFRVCNYQEVYDSSDVSPMLEDLLNELISRCGLTTLDLVSGYYQVPLRTQERDSVSVLPQIERRESDEENVCMIKNYCVDGTGIEKGRGVVVERVKKEFSDLNGSGLKSLGRVLLTQSAINTEDSEPVRTVIRRVPDQRVGELNLILDEILDAGVIIKSESVWCSSTMCVQKSGGPMRLCIDCREVNSLRQFRSSFFWCYP